MEPYTHFERLTGLILAAEDWHTDYKKDAVSFGKLVKAEAKLNRLLLEYFKGLSERAPGYINWNLYQTKLRELQAAADDFQVDVIVTDLPDSEDGLIMNFVYDPLAAVAEAGLLASEFQYKIILDADSIPLTVSKVAKRLMAELVGKRIDKDGNIIDNPKAKYRISDTTRQQIRDSIRTSLSLGEDQNSATERLAKVIKDPKRAAKIASTEAVNGYQGGIYEYAQQTGAVGKEWQALPTGCRICLGNQAAGIIKIDELFPSGHQKPSAHPYDRCGLRYVYPEELNQ